MAVAFRTLRKRAVRFTEIFEFFTDQGQCLQLSRGANSQLCSCCRVRRSRVDLQVCPSFLNRRTGKRHVPHEDKQRPARGISHRLFRAKTTAESSSMSTKITRTRMRITSTSNVIDLYHQYRTCPKSVLSLVCHRPSQSEVRFRRRLLNCTMFQRHRTTILSSLPSFLHIGFPKKRI
jgi:hypothetical protein